MPATRQGLNAAAALLVACAILETTPAYASGQILCNATDGLGASIEISIGHLPVLSVIGATVTDGSGTWSTSATGDQHPMVFGQGFSGGNRILVDFTDPKIARIVVSLRLFEAAADEGYAVAGILSFEDRTVFPVQCDNG
jgi:hypothetical protein